VVTETTKAIPGSGDPIPFGTVKLFNIRGFSHGLARAAWPNL